MMIYLLRSDTTGSFDLQTTLAAGSSGLGPPHHPITCQRGPLRLHEDGAFACEHVTVPPGDTRTQTCIDQSIAILLIELLKGEA